MTHDNIKDIPTYLRKCCAQNLRKQYHSTYRGAHRPNASPDGVGGADGKAARGAGQQDHAGCHAQNGDDGRDQPREALSVFQPQSLHNFKQTSDNEDSPSHRWGI